MRHHYKCFKKLLILGIFIFGIAISGYSQKEIIKNGIKINRLDKKNKKQGSWFLFDQLGNLEMSCYYKNDSIVTPIVFYKNQDSTFIRYPKVGNSETFMLKINKRWALGNVETVTKDSLKIEILGLYKKTGEASFDIEEDTTISNVVKNEAEYWLKKEIFPIYMFGTETIKDVGFRVLNSSKFIFNKAIYVDITLTESGIIEKIEFPRNLNHLNGDEESELSYLFLTMERWQPYFSKNKTERFHKLIKFDSTLK